MKEKFDYLIKKYNTQLNAFPNNPNEVYKWEALQYFQENWNENAVDFYTMFNEAFKKKANLVYQNSFGFLDKLGKTYPDKLKHLFQLIFENTESDFYEILEKGKNYADDLISDLKEKLGKDVLNHQFDERTLSFLLFLRYPEKNTLFKADVYEHLCSFLEVSQEEKKYDHFITLLNQMSVQAVNSISLEQRNKFIPTGFDYPLLLAQDIVWQALISVPKNNFQKAFNSLPQQNLRVFYDFLDTIINELTLGNTYNQVFSVTNDALKYHIGKRICLALDKSGFVFITNNQTVLNKKREDFTNPENAFLYYNCTINELLTNKEIVINAIREEIKLDRETYRKNYDNAFFRKSVFNKKYRAKLVDSIELITFSSLDQLVKRVNSDLGNFCRIFQIKRKELFGKKKMNSANQLFVYSDNSRDWAINEGGGTELQYHLYFRDNEIGYGLGFNAQYVPFANEYTPQDYMKPFALSYLNQPLVQSDLQKNGFKFVYGSKERLANLQLNDYILIGKKKDCIWNEETNAYEFSSYVYNEMLEELKGIIFRNYIAIIEQRNTFTSYNQMMEKNTELLKYKKQIILQGPPGTGKTREAKLIAKSLLGLDETLDIAFFRNALASIKEVKATNNNNPIFIDFVKDDIIHFKETRSVPKFSFSLKELFDCYLSKDYKNDDFVQYPQYSKRCLVLDILKANKKAVMEEQCKLIQFHPSYTYEDFVRGIVSQPNPDGEGIIFKAENKTLGKFAKSALDNYLASKGVLNTKSDFENKFIVLLEEINVKIDAGETYKFSDKSKAEIISVGNDYLIYNFPQRQDIRYKLLFSDIEKVFNKKTNIKIPIDLRDRENELQLEMKGKYPYYFMILEKLNNISSNLPSKAAKIEKLKNYILIIDEINRANLSSVLGELIYALEYRGEAVESMYDVDGNELILPPNLYIIGTMNTADRSVGHIDYAIRRRFAFVNVLPKDLSDDKDLVFDSQLFSSVKALFTTDDYKTHSVNLSNEFDPKDVALGHSYFIQQYEKDMEGNEDKAKPIDFQMRLDYEIKPILLEYVKDGILIGNNIIEKIEQLETSI